MQIIIPTNCPSCGSVLELLNGQLFCRSKSCPAQSSKLLENFCSKLKLKGFGPATLTRLELSSVPELFNITKKELVAKLGEKVGEKLFLEVSRLKKPLEFQDILGALGIPLIGEVAAKKLAIKFNSFTELKDLEGKAGENLAKWLQSSVGREVVALPWVFVHKTNTQIARNSGIVVCITGSLRNFKSRTMATQYLNDLGVEVKTTVSKSVNYLICEDSSKTSSSSYKKAEKLGIEILTIKQLLEKINK